MATLECWFDLDGVIRILPLNLKEIELNRKNEKLFWHLQRFWFLQRTYNFLIRKPNLEIIAFMGEPERRKESGSSLVSATQEHHRKELNDLVSRNENSLSQNHNIKKSFLRKIGKTIK